MTLPSGTVTFLFTDIEDSTKLWEQHPEAMKSALAKHDSILREAIESNRGHIIKTTGDGVHAVFEKAVDGINASLRAQRDFAETQDSSFSIQHSAFTLAKLNCAIMITTVRRLIARRASCPRDTAGRY